MSLLVPYVEQPEPPEILDDPCANLPFREQQFVYAYIGSARFNATKAAAEAGYQGNKNTLKVTGHTLIRRERVRTAIKELLATEGASEEDCIARVTRRARASLADLFIAGPDGKPYFSLPDAIESGALDTVRKFKFHRGARGDTFEVEQYDAAAADALLLRVYGRLTERSDPGLSEAQLAQRQQQILDIISRHVKDNDTLAAIEDEFRRLDERDGESPSSEPGQDPPFGSVDSDQGR